MTTSPAIVKLAQDGTLPDDPIVIAYSNPESTTIDRLRACQLGIAKLYAQLRWVQEHPSQVDDVLEAGRAISRRIRAIKKLTELELSEHRLRGKPEVDIRSAVVTTVVALLVQEIIGVTQQVVPPEDANIIVDKFEAAINDKPDIPWP